MNLCSDSVTCLVELKNIHQILIIKCLCCADRSPNNDGDVCTERESYALSAGFALGMVTLGQGNGMPELSDLNMSDKLFHFMTGKHKRRGRIGMHL